jgi:hypothetical protein
VSWSAGGASAFLYVDTLQTGGGANAGYGGAQLMALLAGNSQIGVNSIGYSTANFWVCIGSGNTDSGVAVPIRQSFELRVLAQNTSGNVWTYSIQYRLCGSSAWMVIASGTTGSLSGNTISRFYGGNTGGSGTPWFTGRWGVTTLFQIGSIAADGNTLLNSVDGLVDPQLNPSYAWYWDPYNYTGNASDTNDGATPGTPLKTLAQIATMTSAPAYGFFAPAIPWQTAVNGVPTGIALDMTQHAAVLDGNQKLVGGLLYEYQRGAAVLTGDTLVINNAGGAEIPLNTTAALFTETVGLSVVSSGGTASPVILSLFKTIASSEWSLVGGKTYTYQATDSVAASVLYQNRITMNHPTGANYSAVAAYVESTPGSFWTDGTTMYVHPFGSTNPGTDGNRYERTTVSPGANVQSGICVSAQSELIKGVNIIGTTLTDPANGGSSPGYAFSVGASASGSLVVFDTCKSDFGSNHDFANVAPTSGFFNTRFVYVNCIAQRGSPYAPGGGYWAFVDYTPPGLGSGNETVYYNCTTGAGAMQTISSAVPSNNGFAWGAHGGNGWQNFFIIGCDFSKSNGISLQDTVPMTVADSKLMGAVSGFTSSVFQRCWIYDEAVFPQGALSNCVLTFNNSSPISTTGTTAVLNHCTIDATAATASTIFTSAGSNSFTMQGCAVLGSVPILASIQSTDTVAMSYNEFQGSGSSTVLNSASLGNMTLGQVQADGWDGESVMNLSPAVDSTTYQRIGQSTPIRGGGGDTDLTTVLFAERMTAGAYEYVSSLGVIVAVPTAM